MYNVTSSFSVRVVGAGVVVAVVSSASCRPKGTAAPADAGALVAAPAVSAAPSLPPEPPPPVADRAPEVPGLEAALGKDAAYQALWTSGSPAARAAFLSYESELLRTGGAPPALSDGLKKQKLEDSAIKLFLVVMRVGKYPDDFSKKLSDVLDAQKAWPNHGVWTSGSLKSGAFDFSSLAAWMRPTDADYLREHIAAKHTGAGPFGWSAFAGNGVQPRPWMTTEGAALDRLALLTSLTPAEKSRRQQVVADAAKTAAAKAEVADAVSVTAATLYTDYEANEVGADAKYKGKKLLVSGTADGVEKHGITGTAVFVQLKTSNPFMHIQAETADGEESKAGALSKGDAVKLLCTGDGKLMAFVQLSDCRFE